MITLTSKYQKRLSEIVPGAISGYSKKDPNAESVVHLELAEKLIRDLNRAVRLKDKKMILEIYDIAKLINFDNTSDRWSNRYNKAIDNANGILMYY